MPGAGTWVVRTNELLPDSPLLNRMGFVLGMRRVAGFESHAPVFSHKETYRQFFDSGFCGEPSYGGPRGRGDTVPRIAAPPSPREQPSPLTTTHTLQPDFDECVPLYRWVVGKANREVLEQGREHY